MAGYPAPRTLKRQAANVIRKAMLPNAWVGLQHLPLPPGFDKDFIILHPKQAIAAYRNDCDLGGSDQSGDGWD